MYSTDIKQVEIRREEYEIVKIDNLEPFEFEEYDLNEPKEFNKYMTHIYRQVCRGSFEYRELVKFLRENMDMNKCSFYENINNIDSYKIKIELHHHPFSLKDICIIVFNKRVYFGESLEEEMVAKEVMFLHYNLLVGLIPLSETVHELVENGFLFVPIDKVLGKYEEFNRMYGDYMTPEQKDTLDSNIEYSRMYNEEIHKDILRTHYVYLDLSGSYNIPTFQAVVDMMNDRIKKIQNKDNDIPLQNPFVPISNPRG